MGIYCCPTGETRPEQYGVIGMSVRYASAVVAGMDREGRELVLDITFCLCMNGVRSNRGTCDFSDVTSIRRLEEENDAWIAWHH